MAGRAAKRIAKDIQQVRDLRLETSGVWVDDTTFEKPEWQVYIQGPINSPWEDGVFKLRCSFPDKYPFEPVKVQFDKGVYHPNVGSGGTICLDIIKSEAWSPSYTLLSVFTSIRSLLSDPNPDSPMNGDAARTFRRCPKEYEKQVRETVRRFGQELKHLARQTQHSERPDAKLLEKLRQEAGGSSSSGATAASSAATTCSSLGSSSSSAARSAASSSIGNGKVGGAFSKTGGPKSITTTLSVGGTTGDRLAGSRDGGTLGKTFFPLTSGASWSIPGTPTSGGTNCSVSSGSGTNTTTSSSGGASSSHAGTSKSLSMMTKFGGPSGNTNTNRVGNTGSHSGNFAKAGGPRELDGGVLGEGGSMKRKAPPDGVSLAKRPRVGGADAGVRGGDVIELSDSE